MVIYEEMRAPPHFFSGRDRSLWLKRNTDKNTQTTPHNSTTAQQHNSQHPPPSGFDTFPFWDTASAQLTVPVLRGCLS